MKSSSGRPLTGQLETKSHQGRNEVEGAISVLLACSRIKSLENGWTNLIHVYEVIEMT
jgi:hypothetical protein